MALNSCKFFVDWNHCMTLETRIGMVLRVFRVIPSWFSTAFIELNQS